MQLRLPLLPICRPVDSMPAPVNDDAPEGVPEQRPARREFSRRLRELRVLKGYRTARSLANALGIDENRYTRYERAEVEPDFELLRKLTQVLGVTSNDLLGALSPTPGGFREGEPTVATSGNASDYGAPGMRDRIGAARWRLAEAIAEARASPADDDRPAASAVHLKATSSVFQELERASFSAIATYLAEPAIMQASAEALQRIQDLIHELSSAVDQAPPST
jgi:transcriptional regulator with XRE-family HTH domain